MWPNGGWNWICLTNKRFFAFDRRTCACRGGGLFLLYGLSDEMHQAWVITRQASAMDAAANFIGAIMDSALYLKVSGACRRSN